MKRSGDFEGGEEGHPPHPGAVGAGAASMTAPLKSDQMGCITVKEHLIPKNENVQSIQSEQGVQRILLTTEW